MHNKSLYNRSIFALVAILYLSFYLLSPFFHYHEELLRGEEKKKYHSHLLQETEQKTNPTECHHIVETNDEHNHPLVINAVITNLPSRQINTPDSELISIIFYNLEFQTESSKTNFTEDFHLGKILEEKSVHSAGNVSPPFFLAA